MDHTKLAVVEGRWSEDSNVSVRGLFDLLSDIHCETPHGYHYEMFCDGAALRNIVQRVAENPGLRYLYVGAHGDEKGLYGSDDKPISRRLLKNMFKDWRPKTIDGLFVGSCLFGHELNAEFLLNPPDPSHKPPLLWVAGYEGEVDWMDSSALDMLFWHTFLREDGVTPLKRIRGTAAKLQRQAPGLISELGFQIYVRKRGKGAGGVQGLLDPVGGAIQFALEDLGDGD